MTKILLVEDNPEHQISLSRRLVSRGFEVIFASNGEEGILKAQIEYPDLILMDMSLPKVSGWEATRILKRDAVTCRIPIIAITAHVTDDTQAQALHAGCDGYAPKPLEFPQLLKQIQMLV